MDKQVSDIVNSNFMEQRFHESKFMFTYATITIKVRTRTN